MKIDKPWGAEDSVIENNDKYTVSRLQVNKGQRTSFHYHKKRDETLMVISGTAQILRDNGSSTSLLSYQPGEFVYLPHHTAHRVIALDDCLLLRISNFEPEDDEVRIDDDYGRQT